MNPLKYKITYYDSAAAQTITICPYVLDIASYVQMLEARGFDVKEYERV